VASNIVLSAAHCFDGSGNIDFVTLGMHKIQLNANESAEYNNIEHIPIAEFVKHPNYIPRGSGVPPLNYDFVMIRLQWASSLYAGHTVALDTPTDDLVLANTSGADLIVMGFGKLESAASTGPNVMQKVVLDYISNEECVSEPYEYFPPEISPVMLCAGRTGRDSCQVSN
jgi:secreted trypsin-like serine protease